MCDRIAERAIELLPCCCAWSCTLAAPMDTCGAGRCLAAAAASAREAAGLCAAGVAPGGWETEAMLERRLL